MGEMDIYMRRRLVALGGLVAFFIIFVLLIRSCGGDDEQAPTTPVAGTTGPEGPATLSRREYIRQADAICAQANAAVGALDPADPQATQREYRITADELAQLRQLNPERRDPTLRQFLAALSDVVDALDEKATALRQGDTVAAETAQVAIDEAEVEARSLGDEYGFSDCGQFLDAGEAPGGAAPGATGTGTAPPADSGGVAPPADTGTAPPADTGTPPPADGGVQPPGDSGGITP